MAILMLISLIFLVLVAGQNAPELQPIDDSPTDDYLLQTEKNFDLDSIPMPNEKELNIMPSRIPADPNSPKPTLSSSPRIERPNRAKKAAEQREKYNAQRERLLQIRKRQKQVEERRNKEMGSRQNDAFETDGTWSATQKARRREQQQVSSSSNEYYQQSSIEIKPQAGGFIFLTEHPVEEFAFQFPTQMLFGMKINVYTQTNNVYGFIKDIQKEKPIKMYIYEENTQIVGQGEFFFENFVYFQAKQDLAYYIRFYSQGAQRLVTVAHPRIFSFSGVENIYDRSKAREHQRKGIVAFSKLSDTLTQLRKNLAMDSINAATLNASIKNFSYFQYCQIIAALLVTVIQVQLIKKMFGSQVIL